MKIDRLCIKPNIQELEKWYKKQIEMITHEISDKNEHICCHEGCSACCSHAIAVFAPEVQMISNRIKSFSENDRKEIYDKIATTVKKLEENNMTHVPRGSLSENFYQQKYVDLDMPCSFLKDGKCLIYDIRPMACVTHISTLSQGECLKKLLDAEGITNYDEYDRAIRDMYIDSKVSLKHKEIEILPVALYNKINQ